MTFFDENLLLIYMERFCNRLDVYSMQYATPERYWYRPVWEPITPEVIRAHVAGNVTAAWYSMSAGSKCKWLAFDFDDASGNRAKLSGTLLKHGWRVIHEGSRSGRDGHLWLFFDEPVDAALLRKFAKLFLKQAAILEKSVEVFPKQDQLNVGGLGNAVRGPLGVHRKPGADGVRGWFDDVEHNVHTQLEWFAEQQPNSARHLLALAAQIERRTTTPVRVQKSAKRRTLSTSLERFDWCEYAELSGFKSSGEWWHGPCPSCRASGHDRSGTHLSISNGGWVGCFRGCSFEDILSAVS